jgi:hypothetical protein
VRLVSFGPQTARALDRYLRLRRQHRLADTPALWLGDRGRGFGYDAMHFTLGAVPRPPASAASIPTCSGTPPATAGWPPVAAKAA